MSYQADNYDDDAELTAYIWHNYRHLLTNLESLADKAVMAEQKAQSSSERMAKVLRERWGGQNGSRVVEALKDGHEVFRKRVRERVLESSGDDVFINRCPSCQRIVATPKAQQCLWCGHDWHKKGSEKLAQWNKTKIT